MIINSTSEILETMKMCDILGQLIVPHHNALRMQRRLLPDTRSCPLLHRLTPDPGCVNVFIGDTSLCHSLSPYIWPFGHTFISASLCFADGSKFVAKN